MHGGSGCVSRYCQSQVSIIKLLIAYLSGHSVIWSCHFCWELTHTVFGMSFLVDDAAIYFFNLNATIVVIGCSCHIKNKMTTALVCKTEGGVRGWKGQAFIWISVSESVCSWFGERAGMCCTR